MPYPDKDEAGYAELKGYFRRFCVEGFNKPIGYVHVSVVTDMPWTKDFKLDPDNTSIDMSGGSDAANRTQIMSKLLAHAHEKINDQWTQLRRTGRQNFADREPFPLEILREVDGKPIKSMPVFSHEGQHIMDINDIAASRGLNNQSNKKRGAILFCFVDYSAKGHFVLIDCPF